MRHLVAVHRNTDDAAASTMRLNLLSKHNCCLGVRLRGGVRGWGGEGGDGDETGGGAGEGRAAMG